MARTERLMELLQIFRTKRYAVTAETLAKELNISIRTVYRDISVLQGLGAVIEGATGVGYILKTGYLLPPLMFEPDELEALVLGLGWVVDNGDPELIQAARNLRGKITAVLPRNLKEQLDSTTLIMGIPEKRLAIKPGLAENLRKTIRNGLKLKIKYNDLKDHISERIIWPFGMGYFNKIQILLSWCELRNDLRSFRLDRILEWNILEEHYPENKHFLLSQWMQKEGLKQEDLY